MSGIYVVAGLIGYLLLLGALAGTATWAARMAARWLGIPRFRWFTEPASHVPGWRLGVVRLVAALAPWTVSFVLLASGLMIDGVQTPAQDLRIEVLDGGAAQQAGVQSGDRITRVGDKRVNDWDHMRAVLKARDAPVELEIERSSKTMVVQVTPRAGRIGVAPWLETRRVGVLGAAAAAFSMPHKVVRAAVAAALGVSGSTAEAGGPIRIARESGQAADRGVGVFATFLGTLAAYLCPFAAGVVVLDGLSSWLFRHMYPEAALSSLGGYRLERQRQAHQFWSRSSVVLCMLLSFFVPCVAFLVVFELRNQLKRALRADGFRVTWLRAVAPDAK